MEPASTTDAGQATAPLGGLTGRARDDSVVARCVDVVKRFGTTVETTALWGVSLEVKRGTVHGLVGENGAGKSTCLSMFSGINAPTSGRVEVLGTELTGRGPLEAQHAGVALMAQEPNVVEQLSAVENAYLGQELKTRRGFVKRREMSQGFREATQLLGIEIPGDVIVSELSTGTARLVELIRVLVSRSQLILFDEPTTSLSDEERRQFYRMMGLLKERGVTQILVSHNLDEVIEHCDVVTVFRDGRVVAERPAHKWTKSVMVDAMVGKGEASPWQRESSLGAREMKTVLRVEGFQVRANRVPVSLSVGVGEIVGLAGLMGSGRSALLRALAGANPGIAGEVTVGGVGRGWPRSVIDARRRGIGYLPEDRKNEGLLLRSAAMDSVLLGGYDRVSSMGYLNRARCKESATTAAVRCRFDPARLDSLAETLSGGTQQKLLLARWILIEPKVLLCDEPTRGVDIAARGEIWETLHTLCDEGMGLLVASSEFDELIDNCHRILVVDDGAVVDEVRPGNGFSTDRILQIIFDHHR